jgi:hypothetical protein
MSLKRKRYRFLYAWLIVGAAFYFVDCLLVTLVDQTSLNLPWFERGIYAAGPSGIVLRRCEAQLGAVARPYS